MRFLLLLLPLFTFAIEIAPTTFDLRSLTALISETTGRNIIITDDIKNLSVNYFIQKDMNKQLVFESYLETMKLKGLHVNDYGSYFIVSNNEKLEKKPEPLDPRNYVIEVKLFETNKNISQEKGFETTISSKGLIKNDFDFFVSSISNANAVLNTAKSLSFMTSLKALEENGIVNILQEPYMVCLDGKKNSWNVGGTIQVLTSNSSSDTNIDSVVRNTYTEKPIGLTISATPQRHKDRIIFDLEITIESVISYNNGLASTSRKQLINSFIIEDGSSILLSGLKETQKTENKSGIPLLQDIPLLGYFFSYTDIQETDKVLSVLVTVKVAK
jgi:general secretion pathway protein D